jgi:hypothetical protein
MVLLLSIFGVITAVGGLVVRRVAMRPRSVPVAVAAGSTTTNPAAPPAPEPPAPEAHPAAHAIRCDARHRARRRRPRLNEDRVIVLATLGIYLVAAWLLAFHYESFNGDAQSRLANAYYVLFSRDPHMAAIGFVWNPLPSLSVMPLLLLKGIVPALATRAFAANLMSAAFGALAVQQLATTLRELGVRRAPRLGLVALFALNPMVLYYSASGMSEALFLLTLIVAARHLARWLDVRTTGALVAAGIALAFAYLARNEAAMAAACAGALVVVVAAARTPGPRKTKVLGGVSEGVVFLAPFVTAFVGWAAVSWLIVGHPFEQFSSQYGNTSQLRILGDTVKVTSPLRFVTTDVLALAPLLPVLVVLAALRAVRTRDLRPLAPLTVLGGVLAFAVLAFLAGKTAPWWRYYITGVPLSILAGGALLSDRGRSPAAGMPSRKPGTAWTRAKRPVVAVVVVTAAALGLPATAMSLDSPSIGREELSEIGFIVHDGSRLTPVERNQRDKYGRVVRTASYLDGLHLPDGSILVDTFSPCIPPVILASSQPKKFVITNDRDFQPVLADPIAFHVPYLLVPESGAGYGSLDAINRAYPSLYADGAGFATLMRQIEMPGCTTFRLYHIDDGTQPTFQQPSPGASK